MGACTGACETEEEALQKMLAWSFNSDAVLVTVSKIEQHIIASSLSGEIVAKTSCSDERTLGMLRTAVQQKYGNRKGVTLISDQGQLLDAAWDSIILSAVVDFARLDTSA